MTTPKTILAIAGAAVALAACATDPYYDDGYYGQRYGAVHRPQDPYYAPGYYYGPNVSYGLGYDDRGDWRERRGRDGDEEHRWHHDHD